MRWSLIASCKNWQNRQLCIPLQNGLSSACVSVYLQRCALKTEMWYRQAQAGPVYLSALCYRVHWPLIWLLMSVLFLEMLCVAFSWNSTFQYWIHTLCKQFRHMLLSGIIFFFYSFSLFPVTVFQLPSHSFFITEVSLSLCGIFVSFWRMTRETEILVLSLTEVAL